MNHMPKDAAFIAWSLGLSVLAAFAGYSPHAAGASSISFQASRSDSAVALESRITEYWKLRCGKDLAGMYEFYSPEYRTRISRTQFLGFTRLVRFDVRRFRITKATITGSEADVGLLLKVYYPALSSAEIDLYASETWVRDKDGRWYKQDEPVAMPFPP